MVKKKIFSKKFQKSISKLSGKELKNVVKKISEILNSNDLSHYKNLRYDLNQYKRVHVNTKFIILFYEKNNIIFFDSYLHHDKAYLK